MEFHTPTWTELQALVIRFPFLLAIALGQICGAALTQTIKKTYLAWASLAWTALPVHAARYRSSVFWLAALTVYGFTVIFWQKIAGYSSYEEIGSIGAAILSPYLYKLTKIVVGWKFPAFVRSWGDTDDELQKKQP